MCGNPVDVLTGGALKITKATLDPGSAFKGLKETRRGLENANIIHGRPDVEEMQRQALAERQAAEQRAADVAGLRVRAQRQAMRANSLYTGGAGGGRTSLGV